VNEPVSRWSAATGVQRGAEYDARWAEMAARGESVHGEADCIAVYGPRSVLDAGCGTGRVAIELARRGLDVVGVDLDPAMLAQARAKAPAMRWVEGDLSDIDLERKFDVVAMSGNVMIFVRSGTEAEVVANMASHVHAWGLLIAGFQLGRGYTLEQYDVQCASVGMALADRFATWEGHPYDGGGYAVSIHRHAVPDTSPEHRITPSGAGGSPRAVG
jgi:SAM-dependent methyltransferase